MSKLHLHPKPVMVGGIKPLKILENHKMGKIGKLLITQLSRTVHTITLTYWIMKIHQSYQVYQ
jgi:hypothetical protein